MFANCQFLGMDLAFPDICMTPLPLPIPIPYLNFCFGNNFTPNNYKVFFSCLPAHNMNTKSYISFGDSSGTNLGIFSGTIMSSVRHITGSLSVLIKGFPATRLTSISIQNGINSLGIRIIPSQIKILMLGI